MHAESTSLSAEKKNYEPNRSTPKYFVIRAFGTKEREGKKEKEIANEKSKFIYECRLRYIKKERHFGSFSVMLLIESRRRAFIDVITIATKGHNTADRHAPTWCISSLHALEDPAPPLASRSVSSPPRNVSSWKLLRPRPLCPRASRQKER